MTNRQANIRVGIVTLGLFCSLLLFIFWLSDRGVQNGRPYDILFSQSVSGLSQGSAVQYSGVPVGVVQDIALLPHHPDLVRVRIVVNAQTPILTGTTATIQGVGFTGVNTVQLSGAQVGAKPITGPSPYGAPLIPASSGAVGELLASAPLLLERLSTLTLRLTDILDQDNQESISGILANTNKIMHSIAQQSSQFEDMALETRTTVRDMGEAARQISLLGRNANMLMTEQGTPLIQDLRQTLDAARKTMDAFGVVAQNTSTNILPNADALIGELRVSADRLDKLTRSLNDDPINALIGAKKVPVYDPPQDRQK